MTRKELVMNGLTGSTANQEFERRVATPRCGSRVAGWRMVVVTTSASLLDIASLASKAPLVSLDTKWNVMVPWVMKTAVLGSMASMASMVWIAERGTDVEVLLVLMVVATNGGVDGGMGLRHRGH